MKPAEVADAVGHPIVDADGHILEFIPAVLPYLRETLGPKLFESYVSRRSPVRTAMSGPSLAERRASRIPQSPWWGSPTHNVVDLASSLAPRLLHERLAELGFTYSVLYPTSGMGSAGIADADMRAAVCRGFNDFYSAAYGPFADRLTVAGIIPMHTPEEAIAELEHCKSIGLKVVAIANGVLRPIAQPVASSWLLPGQAHWWDFFGLDSEHNYDPVWAKFRELGYAVTVHGGLSSPPTWVYTSITSWMANHIGSFASMTYPTCKSLYLGGVTKRFPDLPIAFQECGVGWAPILLSDTISHWEKRNNERIVDTYDPGLLDMGRLSALMRHYGPELVGSAGDELAGQLGESLMHGAPPYDRDEWSALGVGAAPELIELFVNNLYFGCEADDPSVAYAYLGSQPGAGRFKPMLGSDISHFDVPDFAHVVPEAYELVEKRTLTPEQFRQFAFANACELFERADPAFFRGTAVEASR